MARNKVYDPDWRFLRNWLIDMGCEEEYVLGEDGEVPEGFDFLKSIHLKKEEIGLTRADCSLCHYTLSAKNAAVPMFCPLCRNVLLFVDITPEMFESDDERQCD